MNPKQLGKLDNYDQEPLGQDIGHLYLKRFGRPRPGVVMSISGPSESPLPSAWGAAATKVARSGKRLRCRRKTPRSVGGNRQNPDPPDGARARLKLEARGEGQGRVVRGSRVRKVVRGI